MFKQTFEGTNTHWETTIFQKKQNIKLLIEHVSKKVDLIIVYGGDGTIATIAQLMINSKVTLTILPSGTANVMAKELGIPIDIAEALAFIRDGKMKTHKIDTAIMNGKPFLIRVNFGIMADMISHANKQLKENIGQMAYGISAIQAISTSKNSVYHLEIDGEKMEVEGVSLTVTNCGNIGIEGFSFLPNIVMTDGFLDVILLKEADFMSMLKLSATTLLQTESNVLRHWRCKEIYIKIEESQKIICDDKLVSSKHVHIKVKPLSLNVLVPIEWQENNL